MQLNELLDSVIAREVYTAVKIDYRLRYEPSQLPKELIEKIETDKEFLKRYQQKLCELLQELGHEDLEVVNIDPVHHVLEVRFIGYYAGCRQFPEIHLKTLLLYYDREGVDICDQAVFDEIVEKSRQDLGEKSREEKEERLERFAKLFKDAIAAAYRRN
ncbi:MAG: hypothetical protein ACP5E9_05440 [Candidatus Methanospirareceae archaeon]